MPQTGYVTVHCWFMTNPKRMEIFMHSQYLGLDIMLKKKMKPHLGQNLREKKMLKSRTEMNHYTLRLAYVSQN